MKAEIRRRVLVVSVIAIVAFGLAYGFLPKPVSVDVATATRGPLRVMVEEEGRTRVKDRFVVSAPVSGYLRRIELQVGDAVRKGQAVAMLEPLRSSVLDPRSRAEAEAAVASARANLDAAKEKAKATAADAEYSRERYNRMRKLFSSGHIAKDDLDQSESEAKKADANLLSAEAAVTAAKADRERAESVLRYSAAEHTQKQDSGKTVVVAAPVSGCVLKLQRESEGVVNSGDPLLDIGNPRSLEVKAEVLSADAVKIRKGMPVIFERWGGDKPLEGRVQVVEPSGFTKISSLGVEEQRVNVIVDFTSPAGTWQGLGDGYRLDAGFIIWESKDVLQAPASALFRSGEGWAVFVVENKRAHRRPVEVGHLNGLAAEVVSGIAEGEVIINHPDETIKDNSRVRPR